MTVQARDRYIALQQSSAFNGVDFIEVDAADRTILRVHFLNQVPVAQPGIKALITGGDRITAIPVRDITAGDWTTDGEARPLLILHARTEGDFSTYRLTLDGAAKLDRAFAAADFSFKAFCPTDFDCAAEPPDCPADDVPVPPIDYLAKDYDSFRRALSEFSAFRYPEWQERSEADFGVMFMEALSSLADDLSYYQDRVAAEAVLETATQRRSLVSLARLVDYEPRPATSATTWLLCGVADAPMPAGVRVSAETPDGGDVPFEIGRGLADHTAQAVSPKWNYPIEPYWWDDSGRCLARGATEMWLGKGGMGLAVGMPMLIQTDLPGESLRQIVHLTEVEETVDPLFPVGSPAVPRPVTRIAWGAHEALARERDLTCTLVGGNLVHATQGRTLRETFAIGEAPATSPMTPLAIARRGPNATDAQPNWIYRHSLSRPGLAWLDQGPDAPAAPEILVEQSLPAAASWTFAPTLLTTGDEDRAFTVDPVTWRRLGPLGPDGLMQWEMDGDGGESLRFGDDSFGSAPRTGDVFDVVYRTGAGAGGNVAADTICMVDPAWTAILTWARNPMATVDGADAETAEHVRRMAPQAFRSHRLNAVRREDYQSAAEELGWVQRAGTAFRWTGSWLTVFTAVDPTGGETVSAAEHMELVQLLNRRRLAGYESYAPPARYASIDLQIEVCVAPDAIAGDVKRRVLQALGGGEQGQGFFFADRFSFGAPLYRSRLEAALEAVHGVNGVLSIAYRRRGYTSGFLDLPEVLPLAVDEILRLDNDPDHPERGMIRLAMEGGR